MVDNFRVTVYNSRIISVIQVGQVDRWSRNTAKDIEKLARNTAPKRTGRLKDSHVTVRGVGSNQYKSRYRVSAMAPYGVYVHQGTGLYSKWGPRMIYGSRGQMMGPINDGGPRFIASSRGQKPNAWLERAAMLTAARI
jgi:hypothetical protein